MCGLLWRFGCLCIYCMLYIQRRLVLSLLLVIVLLLPLRTHCGVCPSPNADASLCLWSGCIWQPLCCLLCLIRRCILLRSQAVYVFASCSDALWLCPLTVRSPPLVSTNGVECMVQLFRSFM